MSSDPVERAVAEWLERLLAGDRVDPEEFARAKGLPAAVLVPRLRNARWLVGRHRTANEERGARLPPPPFRLGDDVQVLEEAGRGGMGVVFRAEQLSLGRPIAIKVLDPVRAQGSPNARARFLAEARAVARLSHAHMVRVLFVGEQDGLAWFAMDWIEGESLAQILARRRREGAPGDPRESALLIAKVARALHHAHEQGLLHRDVKPANILVDTGGEPHLSDFGIVRELCGDGLTLTGEVVGSPPYMSPEQVRGTRTLDARSDVYALGVTLYQCLTLELPFAADSVGQLKDQILHAQVTPPADRHARVPKDLQWICLGAMAREPAVRFPSAAAMAADLEAFLRGEPVMAGPPSLVLRARRALWRRRRWLAAVALVLGLLILARSAWQVGLRLDDAAVESRCSRIALARLTEDRDVVLAQLDQALREHPREPRLLVERAILLLMESRLEPAERDVVEALRARPDDAELALLARQMAAARGIEAGAATQPADAQVLTGPALTQGSAHALHLRGALLAFLGRWPQAIELLLQARARDRSLCVEDALVQSYRRMGRLAEAGAEMDRVLALRESPRVRFNRCQLAFVTGQRERADQEVLHLVRTAPESAFTGAARILQIARDPEQMATVEELASDARQRADWPQARFDVARGLVLAYQAANQPGRIVRLLDSELAQTTRDPMLRYVLGIHLIQLADQRRGESGAELRKRGLAALEQAAHEGAHLPMERDFLLGMQTFHAGQLPAAVEHLRRAAALAPEDPNRWRPLAMALATLANRSDAPQERLVLLEEACAAQAHEAALTPGNVRARFLQRQTLMALAAAYEAAGDPRAADVRRRIETLPEDR